MNQIVKALVETGYTGYFRPDHGRMIWGETGKPGYGLYDRHLERPMSTDLLKQTAER